MSQKWIRSKRWDDQHLSGWLLPLKLLLRTFSSVWFAVILLSFVALYGVLAAIPIGLLALAPTYFLYGLILFATAGVVAVAPAWIAHRIASGAKASPPARFAIVFFVAIILVAASWLLFRQVIWPQIHYDGVTGKGFRLFGGFVDRYKSTTIRRMPGVELAEIEFYSAWPLRLVLFLFVLNLVTATVRRIEFIFPNIGVLTVHSGIILIALGSAYYGSLKQEGDVPLTAGQVDSTGHQNAGPVIESFYDQLRLGLWVRDTDSWWEQRPLRGIPRYNDYNLDVLRDTTGGVDSIRYPGHRDNGPLDIRVPAVEGGRSGARSRSFTLTGGIAGWVAGVPILEVGEVSLRIVGYVNYTDWTQPAPVRLIELIRDAAPPGEETPTLPLYATVPAGRLLNLQDVLAIEYTRGMSEQRREELLTEIPEGTSHAVIIRIPATGEKIVRAIQAGASFTLEKSGYRIEVKSINKQPPLPIISPGYEQAQSSVVIVRVTPPEGHGLPFERWVYHRFPELNQDLVDRPPTPAGQPAPAANPAAPMMASRRKPDPAIDIAYLDTSLAQIYFDELPAAPGMDTDDPPVRAIFRPPFGPRAQVSNGLHTTSSIQIAPAAAVRLGMRTTRPVPSNLPYPTEPDDQNKQAIGTHQRAAIAVEVSAPRKNAAPWTQVVWLPFHQYFDPSRPDGATVAKLPDGQEIHLAFDRLQRSLPRLSLQLTGFEMIPYPGSDEPRDFRSALSVTRYAGGKPGAEQWITEEHITSLNSPLLIPVAPMVPANAGPIQRGVASLLNAVTPMRYKFSQVGWDQTGWMETLQKTRAGEAKRPTARFTILGVGNNPGIRIIAIGGWMMGFGIPWAFYIKPMIMRGRKLKIQRELTRQKEAAAAASGSSSADPHRNGVPASTSPSHTETGVQS